MADNQFKHEESYIDERGSFVEMHSSRIRNWSQSCLTEHKVIGPTFSPSTFKTDFDQLGVAKNQNLEDVDQSPNIEFSLRYRQQSQQKYLKSLSPLIREVVPKSKQRPSILISQERAISAFEQIAKEHSKQQLDQHQQHQSQHPTLSARSSQSSNDYGDEGSNTPSSSKVNNSRFLNNSEFNRSILKAASNESPEKQQNRSNLHIVSEPNNRFYMLSSLNQQSDSRSLRHNASLSPSKLIRAAAEGGMMSSGRGLMIQPISSSVHSHRLNRSSQPEMSYHEKSVIAGSETINEETGFKGVWVESAFQILTLTKKFITNIKELSMRFKFSQMRQSQFDLIDDVSTSYSFYQVRGYLKNDIPSKLNRAINWFSSVINRTFLYVPKSEKSSLKICISKTLQMRIGVLLPDSPIKILWDCAILFLLFMNIFYIPMKISFDGILEVNSGLYLFLDDLPTWAFVCDIVLNFNTATYSKGVISSERSKIFKHYIKGSLYWDILVVGPFFFSSLFNVSFVNIILLLRYNKILKIISSIEELMNLKQLQATMMSLVKLVMIIVYVAHLCGCFFYYMHVLQIESDPNMVTWVVKFDLEDSGWLSLYVSSVYWAVITMITLGYGDIYPITTIEKVYVIIVTMISCGVFAYAVNQIGYIIQEMTKRGVAFRAAMSSLTNHMKQRQLSNVMQMRVRKYFEYLHHEEQEDNEVGQKMLGKCNILLRKEVLTEMYGKVLASRKEFRLNFSKEFLLKLAPKMRESRLGPEETVFKENEHIKRVYILMRGNIALQRTRKGPNDDQEIQKIMNIKILKKGDVCGLESFLSNSESMVSAKSLNVVSLVSISKDDFLSVLSEFKDDTERYAMMKDKLNLQKTYRGLGINCYLCDSYTHQFLNCPYMSYQPNQKKVIHQYQLSQMQYRAPIERPLLHTPGTIQQVLSVQEAAIRHLFENNPYETLNDLIERIQILEEEGALQINTMDILSKYIKDPHEFNDIDDLEEDHDIEDEFVRAQMMLNEPMNSNMVAPGSFVNDDSIRNRRATVGSRPEQKTQTPEVVAAAQPMFRKRGSLRITRSNIMNLEGQLAEFDRKLERKPSLIKKQTMFSDHDKVYIFKNKEQSGQQNLGHQNSGDITPSRHHGLKQSGGGGGGATDSLDGSENQYSTPQSYSHNHPGTPQQLTSHGDRVRDKSVFQLSKASRHSLHDQDEELQNNQIYQNPGNSQISMQQLDYTSVRSSKSNPIRSNLPQSEEWNQINYAAASAVVQIKDFMTIMKFEKAESWSLYFPHNNLAVVLGSYLKQVEKRIALSLKQKRSNRHKQTISKKNVQKIISNIQARNAHKRQSSKFVRSQKTRQSYISQKETEPNPGGDQNVLNPLSQQQSYIQMLYATSGFTSREPSRSLLSSYDANSEAQPSRQENNQ